MGERGLHGRAMAHQYIIMQKTRQPLYLPLSMQAKKWMPERDAAEEDSVFATLPCENTR